MPSDKQHEKWQLNVKDDCWLEIADEDYYFGGTTDMAAEEEGETVECDGCGRDMPRDEPCVAGIRSCWIEPDLDDGSNEDACCRVLCFNCVKKIAKMVNQYKKAHKK